MKLYAPSYYKNFKCAADKCRHSCCVGWEIPVDRETLSAYRSLPKCQRDKILQHISESDEGAVISRDCEGRCPFLMADGLCSIISELGDSYISEICREHPRFYVRHGDGVAVGVGASCPVAAELILGTEKDAGLVCIGDTDKDLPLEEYDAHSRYRQLSQLIAEGKSFNEICFRVAEVFALPLDMIVGEDMRAVLSELEYMMEDSRTLLCPSGWGADSLYDEYLTRFFSYLCLRHTASAVGEDNFRARIAFCILLTKILENCMNCKENITFREVCDLVVRISEEIEYSEDNTDTLTFELECML